MSIKQTSDGGSTSYYELPPGATELNDLIEYKQMEFWRGNCFKALWRLDCKEGFDEEYDLRKIKYFVDRRLAVLRNRSMEPLVPAMYGGLVEDGSDAF